MGTGLGIAFFMFRASRGGNIYQQSYTAATTVLADYCFTLPAVIIQPITGIALISLAGHNPTAPWLIASYIAFGVAGLCWLPVVWIQIQLKKLSANALKKDETLPNEYYRWLRVWIILGWPAFISLLIIFYLMVVKPQ